MIFKPAGYAIWENIQHELDRRFKETGVENVYMPMFILESLLERERIMSRDLHRKLHGSPMEDSIHYRKDFVSDRPQRLCSAISIRMRSSHTETCQRYITSGALLSVGKRRPDLSFVPESSCGRKVTQHMQQQRRLRSVHSRC